MVLDCRDPQELAAFWAQVLGGTVSAEDEDWVVVVDPAGRRLAFQTAPEHVAPLFPDPKGSQQLHLDIQVKDIDVAQREVLALGARRVGDAPADDDNFRVYQDPAGHTFCLIWDVDD